MSRMRRLYQRAAPDKTEVNILRGILAAVQRQGDTSHKTQGDTE